MLGWFAETTLVASGLAVVAVLASRLRPIGPTARHALWLVVLIKLMTPPLVCWPWAALGETGDGTLLAATAGAPHPWRPIDGPVPFDGPPVLSDRQPPRSILAGPLLVAARRHAPASDHQFPDDPDEDDRDAAESPQTTDPARAGGRGWLAVGLIFAWLTLTRAAGARSGGSDRPVSPPAPIGRAGTGPPGRGGGADRPVAGRPRARTSGRPRPGYTVGLVPGPAQAAPARAAGQVPRPGPMARHPGPRTGPPPPRRPLGQPARAGRRPDLVVEPRLLAGPHPTRRRGRAGLRCLGGLGSPQGPSDLRRGTLPDLFDPVPGQAADARVGCRRLGPILREAIDDDLARPRTLPALPLGLLVACLLAVFALPSWSAAEPVADESNGAPAIAAPARPSIRSPPPPS